MKKGFTALVVSAVVCSLACASPTGGELSFGGLSAGEHAALFGQASTAKVAVLDNTEMKNTEGELLPYLLWTIGVTYSTYANAPSWNYSQVYTTWPNQTNMYVGGMFVHYSY